MKFDLNFEETILSRCMRDQGFLKKASPLLEAHHFGTSQHSWIWRTIKSIWEEFREKPNGKLLVSRAKHDFAKEKDLELHLELVKKIANKKTTSAHATLAEMERFVRFVNAQRVLEEAAKELEKDKVNKAWDILNKASRQDVKPKNYQIIRWIEEFKQRQADRKFKKENPDNTPRIPTGFHRLDKILGGGIEVEELGLIIATTGKGKSITLSNLAFWSSAFGFPTLYFTLEMRASQIAQRIDSRWTSFEYMKFKNFDFIPSELRLIENKYKHAVKKFGDKLMIVELPVRKTTVEDLVRVLDDLQEDYNFIPKMIAVDSGDHMTASKKYESHRLNQADVFWGLKWLAQQGYAVWSSSQAGREHAKGVADAESVSESYDKGRIADLVISLNTPEKKTRSTRITTDDEDDEDDESILRGKYMELFLGKYRDGEDKITIPMDAQFARMYISEQDKDE